MDSHDLHTNLSVIRSMCDTEFADFMCVLRAAYADGNGCTGCPARRFCSPGHNGMMDWLRSDVDEKYIQADRACKTITCQSCGCELSEDDDQYHDLSLDGVICRDCMQSTWDHINDSMNISQEGNVL